MSSILGFMLPMASLLQGFEESNLMGKGIVLIQIASSIIAFAIILGKWHELKSILWNHRHFVREFLAGGDVLGLYLLRKKMPMTTLALIYDRSCERLIGFIDPESRRTVIARQSGTASSASLSPKEVELVRSTCEHSLEEEEMRIESGMSMLATIVTISPMLGLLGTVWGVLDAFSGMGERGTILLSSIAPAISSALLTTVVGLLVAIPSAICYNWLLGKVRQINNDMEGFADEFLGRVACEFQGRSE